jgi:phage gp16-like protein
VDTLMKETPRQDAYRHHLYRVLMAGKRCLSMEEEDYRKILERNGASLIGDKYSATTMTIDGLKAAIDEMRAKGFTPQGKTLATAAAWRKPRIAKITAIWCALADAGVVKNRGEAAMVKFCARITGKARLEWAESEDLNNCIQALRAWAKNTGVKLEE